MATELVSKIDAWWAAFAAKTLDLCDLFSRRRKWDLPAWMHEHLGAINEHLMWEYGPAINGEGYRLVITPEGRRHLRPLAEQILSRAPRINDWEFYAYRLPEDFEMTEQTVKARSGGNIAKTFFRAAVNDFNKIDLVFLSRDYSSSKDQKAWNDVFVATETLVGEEITDRWIGTIEVAPLDHGPDEPQGVRDLKIVVGELILSVKDRLPNVPYFRLPEDERWSGYELTPEEAEDYPHQWDMFVGKTMIGPMWSNAHQNQSFDSIRFSKHGEIFCYLKIDGVDGLEDWHFADKGEIEDAVDAALRKAEVGCFVGGGTGLRYSYLDLALMNVERGWEILRPLLRHGKLPKRTWLQFFDTDLQNQWLGLWDDTPPPPMPDFEEE